MVIKCRPEKFDVIIQHTAADASAYNPAKVIIQKQDAEGAYKEVYTSTTTDFSVTDASVASEHTYTYRVLYLDATDTILNVHDDNTYTVDCVMDGIAIMDDTHLYVSVANWSYEHARETSVSFVQPFYRRMPLAIVNGDVNYETGSVTGLFAPFDEKGNPVYANQSVYRHAMLNWLGNGLPKTLKTADGYCWKVVVSTNFFDRYSVHLDNQPITFQWTEVDGVPETAALKEV